VSAMDAPQSPPDHMAASGGTTDAPRLKQPLQERSRRTLQKILSAGAGLLETDGPEALTVAAITRIARISVGSFYARFQGKDDLLRFLGEEALADVMVVWRGRQDAGLTDEISIGGRVDRALGLLLPLYLKGAGRTLALLEGVQDPSPTRRVRIEGEIAEALAEELGVEPRKMRIRVRALVGLLQDAARASLQSESPNSELSFLTDIDLLREEGGAFLTGGRPRGEGREIQRVPPPVDALGFDRTALGQEAVATPTEAAPPEPDRPSEPDPFDIWG